MQIVRRSLCLLNLNLKNGVNVCGSFSSVRWKSEIYSDVDAIAKRISESSSIVFMTGAGLSTASGIPDFRSPTTGIYANLEKFKLPYPEAIFELEYFKTNPGAFNIWAKEYFPGINFLPNKGHYFIKLLEEKGKLSKYFTQNIDGLERLAGVDPSKICEAHGTFSSASCTSCQEPYPMEDLKSELMSDLTPVCKKCNGFVKPDIVFFGENLPKRFFDDAEFDCLFSDLLICVGTSLEVYPFAGIVDLPRHNTARLLINNEIVGSFGSRPNDTGLLGDIQKNIEALCDKLGWSDDLTEIQLENEIKIMKNQK